MVVTYLLILTGVVGYACWRGYQLEVWVGELSKSVGQVDMLKKAESLACYTVHSEIEQRLDGLDGEAESINLRLAVLEKAAKKPRGRK